MFRYLLILVVIIPLAGSCQESIGKSKDIVKAELETWKKANAGSYPTVTEIGSNTTLSIKDPGYGQVKFIYTFDKSKTCIRVKTVALTDSARNNYLNNMLEKKEYEWVKLNGNQYISKFSDKLMIELPGDPKNHSVTVYRAEWNQEIYNMLLNK